MQALLDIKHNLHILVPRLHLALITERAHKINSNTLCIKATCSANPVQIGLLVTRQIYGYYGYGVP